MIPKVENSVRIDLIKLGNEKTFDWTKGNIYSVDGNPCAIASLVEKLLSETLPDAFLFWNEDLGDPEQNRILDIFKLPGDVWHSGLSVGMNGVPKMINYVDPNWIFNLDLPDDQIVTSWRMTLDACLIRSNVLIQVGNFDPEYKSVEGSSIDLGFRLIKQGAIIRFTPNLITKQISIKNKMMNEHDELRFILKFYKMKWMLWVFFRSLFSDFNKWCLIKSFINISRENIGTKNKIIKHPSISDLNFNPYEYHKRISILIPTLSRYQYLKNELNQLRHQTIKPLEIMIMDQTPEGERDTSYLEEFSDLPINVFLQEKKGQCTGWNKGLLESKGDYIVFLGDDADEIEPDFLEKFIKTMILFKADMVASLVDEAGSEKIPRETLYTRLSDTFPISMVTRKLLVKTGLMDYAFDKGKLADQDLSIRCLKSGALMIFNPEIRVFHHRALVGGLRAHNVRVITRSSSRKSLFQRLLPSVTELYIGKRYYNSIQQRERVIIRLIGAFSINGGKFKKLAKVIISGLMIPNSIYIISKNNKVAEQMLIEYPKIPFWENSEI